MSQNTVSLVEYRFLTRSTLHPSEKCPFAPSGNETIVCAGKEVTNNFLSVMGETTFSSERGYPSDGMTLELLQAL